MQMQKFALVLLLTAHGAAFQFADHVAVDSQHEVENSPF